jgi:hypothetical protein
MKPTQHKKSPSREGAARFRKIREQMPSKEKVMSILEDKAPAKERKSAKPPEVET